MWVNPELNASDAFVAAWLPGSEGGGVADLLFRRADGSIAHDFTGKLAYSWPRWPGRPAPNRGDADYDPLFPFGFGLSVTDDGELSELPEGAGTKASAPTQGEVR
jgi:beta-glucosidase